MDSALILCLPRLPGADVWTKEESRRQLLISTDVPQWGGWQWGDGSEGEYRYASCSHGSNLELSMNPSWACAGPSRGPSFILRTSSTARTPKPLGVRSEARVSLRLLITDHFQVQSGPQDKLGMQDSRLIPPTPGLRRLWLLQHMGICWVRLPGFPSCPMECVPS